MKRIIFLLSISIVGLVACKDKKKETETTTTVEQKTESAVADPAKDSTEIRKVITDFYNWYTKNDTKFQDYKLYSSIKKNDMPPYKINWDEVTKYQDFIRTAAPQLGEDFFSNQKKMLLQCDSAFKVDVQDEIPYGFDYDWYTNSQEDPQYTLELLNRNEPWNMKIDGDKAEVEIGVTQEEGSTGLIIQLKKEKNKWTIAKIGGI